MKIIFFKKIFIVVITILFSSNFIFADEMKIVIGKTSLTKSDKKRFEKYGDKISKYKELDKVWKKAERNAAKNILLKEYNKLLTEEDAKEFKKMLKSEIFPVAEGFIINKRLMSKEIEAPGKLVLRFEMSINVKKFKKALVDIGVSFDVKSRKSVMLLIEEYFKPDYIPSNKGALKKEVIKREKLDMKEYDKTDISSEKGEVISDKGESFASKEELDETYMLEMKREREKIVREYFPPDLSGSKIEISAALAEIGKSLLKKDVNIIDEEYTKQMRSEFLGADGYLPDLVLDEGRMADFAAKAREKYAADIVVIGCVNSVYNGEEVWKGKINHATTSNLVIKMVDTANGQVLGYEQGSESAVGNAATVAAQRSSAEVGVVIGKTLSSSMFEYIKNREKKGYEYVIFFKGASLNIKEKTFFIRMLRDLEGTTNINERSWDMDAHVLEVVVSYKGSSDEFKETMFMQMWEDPLFANFNEAKSKGSVINLILN